MIRNALKKQFFAMNVCEMTLLLYRVEQQNLPVEFFLEFLPHASRYESQNWCKSWYWSYPMT